MPKKVTLLQSCQKGSPSCSFLETGWWFWIIFYFHPYKLEMIQFDFSIVFKGVGSTTNFENVGWEIFWVNRMAAFNHPGLWPIGCPSTTAGRRLSKVVDFYWACGWNVKTCKTDVVVLRVQGGQTTFSAATIRILAYGLIDKILLGLWFD